MLIQFSWAQNEYLEKRKSSLGKRLTTAQKEYLRQMVLLKTLNPNYIPRYGKRNYEVYDRSINDDVSGEEMIWMNKKFL
ncbi:hypothetical protein SNEBB_007699 [Seison nebaliae]|nr:hypothetical protein SNEBB_007699 [Seison nebaliae]